MRPILLRSLFSAVGLLMVAGCQDYLFERVCAEQIREEERTVTQAPPRPADILFVVDNSGSMREEQQNLADNFSLFINELASAGDGQDYQIAVVTTDQISELERDGLAQFEFSDEGPYFARTQFNRAACFDTDIDRGCFRGPDVAARIINSAAFSPEDQVAFFQENVRVGTCGTGEEQGLKAMQTALSQLGSDECNAGFLRERSNLVVIFVSDENDDDDTPIERYLDFITSLKSADQLRVAAIVGFADGEANDCRTVDGRASTDCGTICATPPPLGSQERCEGADQGTCNLGETCFDTGQGRECRDALWALWNNRECSSCSVFDTPDCCLADAGTRYVQFTRQLEQRIVEAAPDLEVTNCAPEAEQRAACLIGSVCEGSFGEILVRIARDLVVVNEFDLTPPAENPSGVRARLVGEPADRTGELEPGVDFVVVERPDDEGVPRGVTVRITNAEKRPSGDLRLEVYYVSEVLRGENQPDDICTSTSAGP